MNPSDELNISPEPSGLDGNAAAGLLQQIFAVDITTAGITCVHVDSPDRPKRSVRIRSAG